MLPTDAPESLRKYAVTITYYDANVCHNVINGRLVNGVFRSVNKTPVEWCSKNQAKVETNAYGPEFSSPRTCVEKIVDLRINLRFLVFTLRMRSFMFGYSKSVVDISMTLHNNIHKRNIAL